MVYYQVPHRLDADDKDSSFYWPDPSHNEFFGQWMDFDHEAAAVGEPPSSQVPTAHEFHQDMPDLRDPFAADQAGGSTTSSNTSTAGSDLHSMSSHHDPIAPSYLETQDMDPGQLSPTRQKPHFEHIDVRQLAPSQEYLSDSELHRIQDISLHSPTKTDMSDPLRSSPSPPSTLRRPERYINAISSGLRKVTTRCRTRPTTAIQRPGSSEVPAPLAVPKLRSVKGRSITARVPDQQHREDTRFVHGLCDDPFDASPQAPYSEASWYFSRDGFGTPLESPVTRSEPTSANPEASFGQASHGPWSQPIAQGQWSQGPDMPTTPGYNFDLNGAYWDLNHEQHAVDNVQFNTAVHAQHANLACYPQIPNAAEGGLMIHIPQPGPFQQALSNHPHIPPPPPIPDSRSRRVPRARSSGARHLSVSPVRKTRAPSASPTPRTPTPHSRHSSGGSITSVRSSTAGPRLPGSMPGTPCSIRKRRTSGATGGCITPGADATPGGFVNFTPSDGGALMTGVAPSGSSKTKARREKEAMDRQRRLVKAVAAAGGDVGKLFEHEWAK